MANTRKRPFTHRWRRYLRFSVRDLIVVMALIGCWLGWIARSARVQQQAVAAVMTDGGTVAYDWNFRHGQSFPRGKPWAPPRLLDLMGIDYFGHVTFVELRQVTDTAFAHAGRFDCLEQLQIRTRESPNIDARLAHLSGLTELYDLNLGCSRVTDVGMWAAARN